jgi:pyruvate ferredoxin oxidoreductase gamma subunit
MPAAGVMQGIDQHTVLVINSHETADTWQHRLNTAATVLILPAREDTTTETVDRAELPYTGSRCAAACAALSGAISRDVFASALTEELAHLGSEIVQQNLDIALTAYDTMSPHAGLVKQSGLPSATDYTKPDWIELPFENAEISAPAIHKGATSVKVRTGLWRTMRPVINYDKCSGCWWVCSTYCPDGAINVSAQGLPEIDYEHCKGCLVCAAQCPPDAIEAIPEHLARQQETSAQNIPLDSSSGDKP